MKKLLAIGGGENGRFLEDGSWAPYETEPMDKEIIKLTNKIKPNFLFLGHAMCFSDEIQDSYYETMKKIYGDKFGCNCKHLKSNDLYNKDLVKELIDWADIIYEGGGDTKQMISLWKETNFDKTLYEAWNKGKVICGISAGAICWFRSCNSDCNSGEFEIVDCLNWFNLFATPHCNEKGRYESSKNQIKENGEIAIMLSNKSAIEIIDDKYRIILNKNENSHPYVLKAYFDKGVYKEIKLTNEVEFLLFSNLFSKNI